MKNLIDDIFTVCSDKSDVTEIDLEEVELLDNVDGPRCNYIRASTNWNTSDRFTGDYIPVQYPASNGPDGKDKRRRSRMCNNKSNVKCSKPNCKVVLCTSSGDGEPNCCAKFHENKIKNK